MIILENEWQSVGFDGDTGALVSLVCRTTGREFLAPGAARGNPFGLWVDCIRPYRFKDGAVAPHPDDLGGMCLSPAAATAARDGGALTLTYALAGGLVATVRVALEGVRSRWTFRLRNGGDAARRVLPVFPWVEGVAFTSGTGRMLAMNQSGYVDGLWGYPGGPYGNGACHSAQFGCLFDGEDCLGFYIEDASFGAKDIRYVRPGLQVRYFPDRELAPGEELALPDAVLLAYAGNWRRTAVAYGDWFRAAARPDPPPAWVREIDSCTGAWAEKRGKPNGAPGLSRPMDTFDDLYEKYLDMPMELFEYAFYCEQSSRDAVDGQGRPLGPQPRRHTDGWNAVRADLGGAEGLRRGVERVHGMGRRLTLYIEGLIVPDDSELFAHIPAARDWVSHNWDGGNDGPYTKNRWVHMCPGAEGWQDHVAAMAARLVRETDADGIRLDSYSFYFRPCYNPAHRHDSPFDYNRWMQRMFEKVAAAVRAVKPDALLSTECPVDYNSIHFNHSLHQFFYPEKGRLFVADTAPLRVALPDYAVCAWNGGAVAQTLLLMPDGFGRPPGSRMERLAVKWQNLRPQVAGLLAYGDASQPNPAASRADAHCRMLRGEDEDVVIGCRPALGDGNRRAWSKYRVGLLTDTVETEVTVPLGYAPAEAWFYDIDGQTLSRLDYRMDGGTLRFVTRSNWYMALLRRTPGDAPALLRGPGTAKAGGSLTLHVEAPSLTAPVEAAVEINGLQGFASVPVRAPGRFSVRLPAGMREGQYVFRLTGKGLRTAVKVVRVVCPPGSPPRPS